MSIFDRLYVPCPTCSKPVEFQTKAGDPYCNTFTLDNAPAEVLIDVMNDPIYCEACGQWFALVDPSFPPGLPPRPNLRAAKVKAPDNPITDRDYRWWPDDRPFSYDDLAEPLRPIQMVREAE